MRCGSARWGCRSTPTTWSGCGTTWPGGRPRPRRRRPRAAGRAGGSPRTIRPAVRPGPEVGRAPCHGVDFSDVPGVGRERSGNPARAPGRRSGRPRPVRKGEPMCPRPTPRKPERISAKQQAFVGAYLRTRNATRAAVAAGYPERSAHTRGSELLDGKTYLVAAEVRRRLDALDKRAMLDADAVLWYLHAAMLFCPADYCLPGDGGGRWRAAAEDVRAWPPEVKALVEEMEVRPDGSVRVRFVSKAAAMALAAKYQLGGKARVVVQQIDWSGLLRGGPPDPDPVEERIRAIEALPDPDPADGPDEPARHGSPD
ncbi:MAG: hypothetical protein C0501_07890 [Isosphaera sp.]|nr:hypothetical protein [Isosphaera sp.]